MSVKTKTLAKSLHTVTALARVAELIRGERAGIDNEQAVHMALDVLGYTDAQDPYGLAAKAQASMRAEA